jgi:cell division protein FtsW
MERRKSRFPDKFLLIVIFSLVMIGFLILCTASFHYSQKEFGSPFYLLLRQMKYGLFGLFLGVLCFLIPLEFFRKWSLYLMLFGLFLTSMVFLPFLSVKAAGATRWISLGSLSFQPSEFLKLASVVYISAWLSKWDWKPQGKIKKSFLRGEWIKKSIPFLVIVGLLIFLLALQPDFGTLAVIIASAVSMYLVASAEPKNLLLILIIFLIFLAVIPLAGYRIERVLVFLDAENMDLLGSRYQVNQSIIAIGSGGLWGKGISFGIQKLGFLPQPIADSIFAVFAEEGGFLGSFLLISLFLAFVFISFRISKESSNSFAKILSIGIAVWIISQAFLNIASVLGIIPFTGIPLPFIAYGGSHLSVELAASGLLLNLSRHLD